MLKLFVTVLCGVSFYTQVKYPHLHAHCGAVTLITNLLWLWG